MKKLRFDGSSDILVTTALAEALNPILAGNDELKHGTRHLDDVWSFPCVFCSATKGAAAVSLIRTSRGSGCQLQDNEMS